MTTGKISLQPDRLAVEEIYSFLGLRPAGSSDLLLPLASVGFRFVFIEKEMCLLFMNSVLSYVKPMPGQRCLRKREDPPGRKDSRMLSPRQAKKKEPPGYFPGRLSFTYH